MCGQAGRFRPRHTLRQLLAHHVDCGGAFGDDVQRTGTIGGHGVAAEACIGEFELLRVNFGLRQVQDGPSRWPILPVARGASFMSSVQLPAGCQSTLLPVGPIFANGLRQSADS